jgi:hypothetical protein
MNISNQTFATTILLLASFAVNAAPLFDQRDELSLSLTADFDTIFDDKDKTKQYPGKFGYEDADGRKTLDVMLEVRGNFRLEKCQVPGLRLVFPKKTEGLFAKQKKLKLVTQCRRKGEDYQDYLVQEYATYRAYEVLTERSFKTRLATVAYTDTGAGNESWTNYGFLIESTGRMAKRLGMKQVDDNRVSRKALLGPETNLFTIYQFLIGNTDFSMLKGEGEEACCHNAKLLDNGSGFIPVPYDYDLAGVINTRYAAPPAGLGIKRVTQRLYRGFCSNNQYVPATLAHINTNKSALYAAFMDERIREKTRKKMTKFLDGFFALTDDPKKLEKKITGKCR